MTGSVAAPEWERLRGSDQGSKEDWARVEEGRKVIRMNDAIRMEMGFIKENEGRIANCGLGFLPPIDTNWHEELMGHGLDGWTRIY